LVQSSLAGGGQTSSARSENEGNVKQKGFA
jgi:hypothetical protein